MKIKFNKLNIFNIYFNLLLLNIVNKSFTPLNFDLRLIILFLGLLSTFYYIKNNNFKFSLLKNSNNFILIPNYS